MKMKMAFLALFLFTISFTNAKEDLDSLWGVWNDASIPDTSRAEAMYKISRYGYMFSQPDSAFYFAELLYDFASEKNLRKEMGTALKLQGISYYIRSEYIKAIEYYQLSYTIYEEISYKKGMSEILNNIGVIYSNQGDYPRVLKYYEQSLKIKEEIGDKEGIAKSLNNFGLVYQNQGDYAKAKDYYLRSIEIKEELSDNRGMAQTLNNLGLVYMNHKEYTKALESYQRSLKICEEISNKSVMAAVLSNLGSYYLEFGDFPKAISYFQQSLKINKEISDERGMAITLNSLGNASISKGDPNQALIWCKQALKISEEINILKEQKIACNCLYTAYKTLGQNSKALEYHERFTKLDDSLHAEETARKLRQIDFARQVLKDSLLREEERLRIQLVHEKEVRNKNRTRNIFLLVAFLMLIAAVSIYRRVHFARKAKNAIQKEKDRSDKLLHNILPSKIAEELKMKGKAEAKNFEKVTILFSNFKGFSRMSEKLSAEELVNEINSCFEPFDEICRKYGIEKIKTIGDSYMAAGGIPVPSDEAVKNTVLAALEMMSFIDKKQSEKKIECELCFEMRIGIHTGPVIAGIVGVSKFHYDIWGDSVNTASRIEGAGEVGKVNISQSTYDLLKNDPTLKFVHRGKVKTKGKGDIEMWFVEKAG
jgi:class 3 adenylate cyclase/Tfp pilus assembly protein PilF